MAVTAQEDISLKFTEAHFEWEIFKLSQIPKKCKVFSSKLVFKDGSEFYLMASRFSETVYEVSVCLHCCLGKSIHCKIRFRDKRGEEHLAKGLHWHCVGDLSTILIKELDTEAGDDMILDDTLTVLCELSVCKEGDIPNYDSYRKVALCTDAEFLSDDLLTYLLGSKKSDVIIYINGNRFPAHKEVLRSRSSVFYAKLQHEMMENCKGVVEINDCDPNCFRDYLRYLYSGSLGSLSSDTSAVSRNNAVGLYWIADKYDAVKLKKDCLVVINNSLSIDNFCDFYNIVFMVQDGDKMLRAAVKFFAKNKEDIISTDKWKSFSVENPQKVIQLLLAVLETVTATPAKKKR